MEKLILKDEVYAIVGAATSREESQVINYLKASGLEVGVLLNFGVQSLEWKRIVLTNRDPQNVDLQSG